MSGIAELGLLSSAAGVVSLGIQVCNSLIQYYSSFKDAEITVQSMLESVTALTKILVLISGKVRDNREIDDDTRSMVEESILSCREGIQNLERKLKKVTITSTSDATWKDRMTSLRRKSLYPFKESTLIKMREISNALIENLQLTLNALDLDVGFSTLSRLNSLSLQVAKVSQGVREVKGHIEQTNSGVGTLVLTQRDENLLKVINWLSPLTGIFEKKQIDTFNMRGRQDGSGLALLAASVFDSWLVEKGKIMWCTGMQGVGKTVTVSFLINHLQHITDQKGIAVAYVYGSYKESERQTATNLVASLLQQLAIQNSGDSSELLQMYEKHVKSRTRPTLHEFSHALRVAACRVSRTYIVIDALDELSDANEDRGIFVSELIRLLPEINLFFMSRPLPHLERMFENAYRLELKASDDDIIAYIKQRMAISESMKAHFKKDPTLLATIVSVITSKVRGMFLMARLYLDSLITKITRRKVKAALENLPEGLTQVYDEVLERINAQNSDHASLAARILFWIFHAVRPLSIEELQCALAVEPGDSELDEDGLPDPDLLVSVCAGIVITDQESGTISLVHYSAQEYFEHNGKRIFQNAQAEMTKTCLTYLLFDDFETGPSTSDTELETRVAEQPLLRYSAQHWGYHARACRDEELQDLMKSVVDFLLQDRRVEMVMQVVAIPSFRLPNYSQSFNRGVHGLSLAASQGLDAVIIELLNRSKNEKPNIEMQDSMGRTALHHAINSGHFSTSRIMLSNGASIGTTDLQGWTPLHLAASKGDLVIVNYLLQQGAEVDAKDGYKGTPLYRAAESGHLAVTNALLIAGADFEVRNSYGQTILHRAAEEGHVDLVRHLVESEEHGEKGKTLLAVKDWYGWTPLYRAADLGYQEVADILRHHSRRRKVKSLAGIG